MIYVVRFAEGQDEQINAGNDAQAMKAAVEKYPHRRIIGVRRAGLLDMSFRRPPRRISRS